MGSNKIPVAQFARASAVQPGSRFPDLLSGFGDEHTDIGAVPAPVEPAMDAELDCEIDGEVLRSTSPRCSVQTT